MIFSWPFMCNRVSWWACRVNSCSTRDSWLCSHLRPPSSIFLSRFLFFHVLLCWLVTSWDPSPLNWACLAHVASPTFCYKKSRLLNLFTLLNKKCPMKQLKQLFWSFLLQHESYFQIVKQKTNTHFVLNIQIMWLWKQDSKMKEKNANISEFY